MVGIREFGLVGILSLVAFGWVVVEMADPL